MAMEREEKSQAQSPNVAQTVSTHLPPQDPFLNPPSDPVDSAGHVLTSSEIGALSLDSSVEMHSLFSQKNLLRLAALADSQRTLSLFTPSIAEVAFRACTGVNSGGISDFYHFFDQQGASQSASASPATTPSSLPIPIPGGVGLHGYNYNYAPSLARTASHNTDVASSYPGSSRPSFSSGAGGKMSGFLGGRHGSIHNHTHNHAQKKKKRRVVDLRRKTSTAASSPTATDRERESEKAVEATREKFDAVTLDTKRDYLLSDTATDAADSTAAVAGDDSTTPTISEEDEDEESDGIFVTPPTSPPRVDVETTPTQKTENARLQTTPTKNKPQHTQYLYPQAISPSPSPMSPPLPLASPYGEHQGHFFTAYPPQYTSAYPMPMPTPVPGATSVAAAAAAAAAAQNPG
ncbi:ERMES complex subunit [Ascosphaera atra]|nr:ERMES complex subunit [Ascosphaera atra]